MKSMSSQIDSSKRKLEVCEQALDYGAHEKWEKRGVWYRAKSVGVFSKFERRQAWVARTQIWVLETIKVLMWWKSIEPRLLYILESLNDDQVGNHASTVKK